MADFPGRPAIPGLGSGPYIFVTIRGPRAAHPDGADPAKKQRIWLLHPENTMNAYAEYMKFAAGTRSRSVPELRALPEIRKMVQAASRHWRQRPVRYALGSLDGLDERLLKDVGLFREHLPNGATRYRRR